MRHVHSLAAWRHFFVHTQIESKSSILCAACSRRRCARSVAVDRGAHVVASIGFLSWHGIGTLAQVVAEAQSTPPITGHLAPLVPKTIGMTQPLVLRLPCPDPSPCHFSSFWACLLSSSISSSFFVVSFAVCGSWLGTRPPCKHLSFVCDCCRAHADNRPTSA